MIKLHFLHNMGSGIWQLRSFDDRLPTLCFMTSGRSVWLPWQNFKEDNFFNPCPAEPGYALPLQTVYSQISWLLQKLTDLDLHCLSFSM